jgi:hypothetical protein
VKKFSSGTFLLASRGQYSLYGWVRLFALRNQRTSLTSHRPQQVSGWVNVSTGQFHIQSWFYYKGPSGSTAWILGPQDDDTGTGSVGPVQVPLPNTGTVYIVTTVTSASWLAVSITIVAWQNKYTKNLSLYLS